MKIEVLGTGCSKCTALLEATKKAVAQKGVFAQIDKVEDIMQIMAYDKIRCLNCSPLCDQTP